MYFCINYITEIKNEKDCTIIFDSINDYKL